MRVGVLSDTHLAKNDDPAELGRLIDAHFADCPVILHAGDLVHFDHFLQIIPKDVEFIAVTGNMDERSTSEQLPVRRIVELGGFRIGIMHGHGAPGDVARRVYHELAPDKPDAIVFGHSHKAMNQMQGNVLMFNPGSPTDRRFAPYCSLGILELGETITGRIIRLEEKR
jgi:hypothetical protein